MSMESKGISGEYANFEASKEEEANKIFKKYNLKLLDNGVIEGPEKPKYQSETPEFNYDKTGDVISENDGKFLKDVIRKEFSVSEYRREVLSVVNSIFKKITGKHYSNYANIIIMDKDDFAVAKGVFKPNIEERGVGGDYNAINLGGLVICEDTGGDNCFSLLFHELGHNLYPDEGDTYKDELRAMYFQIVGTKLLEKELERIGTNSFFPEYSEEKTPFPSKEHLQAYLDAKLLYLYQLYYDEVVKGDEKKEKIQNGLLEIVKQDTKFFAKS